jgi:hypothetical protein
VIKPNLPALAKIISNSFFFCQTKIVMKHAHCRPTFFYNEAFNHKLTFFIMVTEEIVNFRMKENDTFDLGQSQSTTGQLDLK